MKTDSLQSTEDDEDNTLSSSESNGEYEPLSSTESESEDEQSSLSDSESDNSEDSNFLPLKRKKPASKTVFEGPSRPTKRKCDEAKKGDKVLVDESEEERNHFNAEDSDGIEELDISEFEKAVKETKGYNSEDSIKTGTHMHFVYLSDDSDSDDKKEDGSQSNSKADTFLSPEDYEDEPSSSRESGDEDEPPSSRESGDEDDPPVKKKQSSTEKTKEKVDTDHRMSAANGPANGPAAANGLGSGIHSNGPAAAATNGLGSGIHWGLVYSRKNKKTEN